MSLRKRMKATCLCVTLVTLSFLAIGGSSSPRFGDPLPNLPSDLQLRFSNGKTGFSDAEVPVPDGLGPVFNNVSCVACHSSPAAGGGSTLVETRFGRITNGQFDPMTEFGGSLIQTTGIGLYNGVNFVGEVVPRQATIVAGRRTTPLFGLGLVDATPNSTFENLAELESQNTPSTAGRINWVTDQATGQQIVGRFGWKCQQGSLFSFSGDAYLNEMGVTTPLDPVENCPQGNCDLLQANPAPTNPNDEDNDDLQEFTDFMTFLAPPPQLALTSAAKRGAKIFASIGCANCHFPTLQTGPNAIAALNNVTYFPFSDFLLHDMGSLGDGIVQAGAGQTEMRTAPLWGVRVMTTFLHDGRATSLAQAILAHDGQARSARNQFRNLNSSDHNNLITFLNSL
jgi:CxxC motif-containing protein (DUF1111 family)